MKFQAMTEAKLLPICDILFVISSLGIYFCDVLFSCLLAYSLFLQELIIWPIVLLLFIFISSMLCQGFSFKWHVQSKQEQLRQNPTVENDPMWITHTIVFLHCLQLGILWRYLRLFIPVELNSVKEQVRDLCMLRVIHAFVQSAPLLIFQLHLIFSKPQEQITDLDNVAASFALISICWALASFGKNVRRKNLDRLVLTWLGIVCQFFWRLGTVSARMSALSLYTILYGSWVLLLLFLHWLTVFLWLLTPNNVFNDEQMSVSKRIRICALVACVYTIDYVNLEDNPSRLKLSAFYTVMLMENLLLVLLWCLVFKETQIIWFESHAILIVWSGFLFGIMFMFLYYKCFHINVLKQLYGDGSSELPRTNQPQRASKHLKSSQGESSGVFNCVLNRGISRKKKKPSTFVPPPNVTLQPGVKMSQPFWKRLSLSRGSDTDSAFMNSDQIKSKLEQKHRKQLVELQKIQEEIQSGRIDALSASTPMPPHLRIEPPKTKRSPWRNNHPQFSYGHNATVIQQMINSPIEYGIVKETKITESVDGDMDTSDTERIPPDALYKDQGSRGKPRQSRPRVRSQHFTPHTQL